MRKQNQYILYTLIQYNKIEFLTDVHCKYIVLWNICMHIYVHVSIYYLQNYVKMAWHFNVPFSGTGI